MKLDLPTIQKLLDELHACDEKIADRGPVKVLPRPPSDVPNVPVLRARMKEIEKKLKVRRKTAKPTGHDLAGDPPALIPGRDLHAVGILEEIRPIKKGLDKALPEASTIVRVRFRNGDHLWFDPHDLEMTEEKKEPVA